jgi:hypothetical protein
MRGVRKCVLWLRRLEEFVGAPPTACGESCCLAKLTAAGAALTTTTAAAAAAVTAGTGNQERCRSVGDFLPSSQHLNNSIGKQQQLHTHSNAPFLQLH